MTVDRRKVRQEAEYGVTFPKDMCAVLDELEAAEAEIKRLLRRGGVARSLIPAEKVAVFHERCRELGLDAPEEERWPCGCIKGETPHGAGWFDCEFTTHKGSNKNPLTPDDLPFTVPAAGRYWIEWNGNRHLLPEAPEGSVLNFEVPDSGEGS